MVGVENVSNLSERRKLKKFAFASQASKSEVMALSETIRRNLGFVIHQVQNGLHPAKTSWRNDIGDGVIQIEVKDENNKNTGRAFLAVKVGDTIYLLHSFKKLSKSTPPKSEKIAKKRFEALKEDLGVK